MLVRGWARATAFYTQHLAQQVEMLRRRTGTALAKKLSPGGVSGGLKHQVGKASELMNEHLGALRHVEGNGGTSIRGAGCPRLSIYR
jgi:hypothetical protein